MNDVSQQKVIIDLWTTVDDADIRRNVGGVQHMLYERMQTRTQMILKTPHNKQPHQHRIKNLSMQASKQQVSNNAQPSSSTPSHCTCCKNNLRRLSSLCSVLYYVKGLDVNESDWVGRQINDTTSSRREELKCSFCMIMQLPLWHTYVQVCLCIRSKVNLCFPTVR